MDSPNFNILDEERSPVPDDQISTLLHEVYVGGGFTDPDVAADAFAPEAVRARGQLLVALDDRGGLGGMVIVVPPTSSARRLAAEDQAEMHLLAVSARRRRSGLGMALVQAAMARARALGYRGMVLWTQPSMKDAHRLYERAGFVRSPEEDFERAGRAFRVYRTTL